MSAGLIALPGLPESSTPGVRLEDVVIGERARKDYGDLTELIESIRQLGLLQPIGVLPGNRLLFGGRRLEACRQLGWESIPCTRPQTLDDALALLKAERDENTCRKDMTPSELVALGRAIEEQERPKAEARQREGLRVGAEPGPAEARCRTATTTERHARTDEIVGAGLGISGSNYQRAKRLVEAAEAGDATAAEAVERMDKTGAITPAYQAWKGRQDIDAVRARAARPQPAPKVGVDKSRAAVAARVEQARDLAAGGHTSQQIATALGITYEAVRVMCRRYDIDVHADKVLGRTRRLDANRVVEQTVRAAEPSADLLAAIDYGDLDPALLGEWISSLSESLKALRSLKTTLEKELFRVSA